MDEAAGASPAQLAAQYEALRRIANARVMYDARGIPRHILGQTTYAVPKDIDSSPGRQALEEALAQVRTILLAEGTEELIQTRPPHVQLHLRDIQFREAIRGIPVSDSNLVLTVDDRTGMVVSISASFLPDRGLPKAPKLDASSAVRAALAWAQERREAGELRLEAKGAASEMKRSEHSSDAGALDEIQVRGEPILSYRIGTVGSEPSRLVWTVRVEAILLSVSAIIVDAVDGTVVATRDTASITREIALIRAHNPFAG